MLRRTGEIIQQQVPPSEPSVAKLDQQRIWEMLHSAQGLQQPQAVPAPLTGQQAPLAPQGATQNMPDPQMVQAVMQLFRNNQQALPMPPQQLLQLPIQPPTPQPQQTADRGTQQDRSQAGLQVPSQQMEGEEGEARAADKEQPAGKMTTSRRAKSTMVVTHAASDKPPAGPQSPTRPRDQSPSARTRRRSGSTSSQGTGESPGTQTRKKSGAPAAKKGDT